MSHLSRICIPVETRDLTDQSSSSKQPLFGPTAKFNTKEARHSQINNLSVPAYVMKRERKNTPFTQVTTARSGLLLRAENRFIERFNCLLHRR